MKFASFCFWLCLTSIVYGQSILIDDFEDGNDDGWTHFDFLPTAAGPAIFDASTFSYNLSSSARIGPTGGAGVASAWDASTDPFYANGFLRAKVIAETDGTSLFLVMRGDVAGNGYSFHANTQVGFQIRRFTGFDSVLLEQLDPIDYAFAAGEDWIMEAGAVNDQLSLKVWRAGANEPTQPQLTTSDTAYTNGLLAVNVGTFPRQEVVVSGTFDDILFTPAVPEPSCAILLLIGFLGLRRFRRSR